MAALPAQGFQTYRLHSPQDITVVTACEQAGCEAWRNGWYFEVDETTDLGQAQAQYFRSGAHRRTYRELARNNAGLTVFRFEAHQRCFDEHRTRPESYLVMAGVTGALDRRPLRRHARADDWAEDLHERIDAIESARERG